MFSSRKNKENFLQFVPIPEVQYELDENNETITLLIPKFRNKFVVKYLLPNKLNKPIPSTLDKFGSYVYKNLDGKRTIYEICELLKNKYGEEVEPVYERVSKFLGILYHHKLIKFKN